MKKTLLLACLLLLSFTTIARDSLFYGLWNTSKASGDAFNSIWGNIYITPEKIYWGRKDDTWWLNDLENYNCSANYEIDLRGKAATFPEDPYKIEHEKSGEEYIFVRFSLLNKVCDYTNMRNIKFSKNIESFLFRTGYNGIFGSQAEIYESFSNKNRKYTERSSVTKIKRFAK